MDSNTPWWREPAIDSSQGEPAAASRSQPQGNSLSYWALVGLTFVLLLAPQEQLPMLAPLRIALLSALLAVLAQGYHRLSNGLPLIDFHPAIKLLLILLAWAVVTVPFSYWPGGSVAYLLKFLIKTTIVFVLLTQVIDNLPKLKGISWALVLMSVPLAATTVGNFISGVQIEGGERVAGYTAGLTANPNDMALMLNLILPLCIALLLDSRQRTAKLLLVGIAGLLVVAIITTFSRAGFLTLVVTATTYAWYLRRRRQRVWAPVVLVLAVCALPLLPGSYVERIQTIVNIEQDSTGSAQTRLSDMKAALLLGLEHPIVGAGLGMNELAMNRERGETWTAVHNVYLQLLVELGFPGLILYLLLFHHCLTATAASHRRGMGKSHPGSQFYLSEGLRVSLIAFAVAAIFYPVAFHFYFYYIAGLAVAASRIGSQDNAGGRA